MKQNLFLVVLHWWLIRRFRGPSKLGQVRYTANANLHIKQIELGWKAELIKLLPQNWCKRPTVDTFHMLYVHTGIVSRNTWPAKVIQSTFLGILVLARPVELRHRISWFIRFSSAPIRRMSLQREPLLLGSLVATHTGGIYATYVRTCTIRRGGKQKEFARVSTLHCRAWLHEKQSNLNLAYVHIHINVLVSIYCAGEQTMNE